MPQAILLASLMNEEPLSGTFVPLNTSSDCKSTWETVVGRFIREQRPHKLRTRIDAKKSTFPIRAVTAMRISKD